VLDVVVSLAGVGVWAAAHFSYRQCFFAAFLEAISMVTKNGNQHL
jgi:hypothetical protein